jgi:Ni,Fe-hydrogenase maturation factor
MGPSPHWEIDLPELLARNLTNVPKRLNKHRTNSTIKINNDFIDYFTNYKNVIFVDVISEFCDKSGCLTHLGDNIKETITSWDYGHLTPVASLKIVNTLISLLKI